jgi:hypothetical protein
MKCQEHQGREEVWLSFPKLLYLFSKDKIPPPDSPMKMREAGGGRKYISNYAFQASFAMSDFSSAMNFNYPYPSPS